MMAIFKSKTFSHSRQFQFQMIWHFSTFFTFRQNISSQHVCDTSHLKTMYIDVDVIFLPALRYLANEISVNVSKLTVVVCWTFRRVSNVKLMHEIGAGNRQSQTQMCVNPLDSRSINNWRCGTVGKLLSCLIKMSKTFSLAKNNFDFTQTIATAANGGVYEMYYMRKSSMMGWWWNCWGFGSFLLFTFFASFCSLIVR